MTGKRYHNSSTQKKSKQILNKYRPVFGNQIFDSIYDFINQYNLFNNNQSGRDLMTLVYIAFCHYT